MQLNEILDEHTVSAISAKTNIAEDNIEALIASDFNKINRVKTLGFISIIEREYNADLSKLQEEAIVYYNAHAEDTSVTLGLPLPEEKKGKSKWFMFVVLLMIVYALWYGFTQLDKEKLASMIPFSEETLSHLMNPDNEKDVKDLSIEHMQSKSVESQVKTNDNTEENRSY
jgi:hypothetical protein